MGDVGNDASGVLRVAMAQIAPVLGDLPRNLAMHLEQIEAARRQRAAACRQRHLTRLTNNTRFLVLPWVRVPHLASHLLSEVRRRLSADWLEKYGHPIELLETFVDRERFRGTCYRAAGWLHVGATTGRSRNDGDNTLRVPVKDIYLLPLRADFRRRLCA